MMVTFVSQCEKNALKKTRRVLDAFANRIGDNVWQTIITQDGLNAVKKLLRRTASKNTAVSCHWIRSRARSELVWVVGRRNAFDEQGHVPVNFTETDMLPKESTWAHIEAMSILAGIAGLFHDVGKANILFQQKLDKGHSGPKFEPFRHEWVSLKIFQAFIGKESDRAWIEKLSRVNSSSELEVLNNLPTDTKQQSLAEWSKLPPVAKVISWLIVSHHRLPVAGNDNKPSLQSIDNWYDIVDSNWNADRSYSDFDHQALHNNWSFQQRTPIASVCWQIKARSLAKQAKSCSLLYQCNWLNHRFAAHFSRLALMLADHYYSSLPPSKCETQWQDPNYSCYANTDSNKNKKQKLDEHNIAVANHARKIAHSLPSLRQSLPKLASRESHKALTKSMSNKFKERFGWQDRSRNAALGISKKTVEQGFFGVNMASTGCGKTLANAKIMYAVAGEKHCRFSIALGLRTLTLQTGDAIKTEIDLRPEELAVLVGSQPVKQLHELRQKEYRQVKNIYEHQGSESETPLVTENISIDHTVEDISGEFSTWLKHDAKLAKLLHAPVLVSTIDYLIPATEGVRGGRQIAPMLRLLSSDLVLDEPDDFGVEDMPALCRLVNWAGMLGSRVLVSTASLPPALAHALFDAYREGRGHFMNATKDSDKPDTNNICCAWFDETGKPVTTSVRNLDEYKKIHKDFVDRRVKKLLSQENKVVKGKLIPLSKKNPKDTAIATLAETIHQQAHKLHDDHAVVCPTGRKVSIGLVRMANINPLVATARQLCKMDASDDYCIHYCIYHSQFPLILRSCIENSLDRALNRSNEEDWWQYSGVREIVCSSNRKNHIFIVLATPVAEVGRDHDYDWAIAEPSSMRSLIQLAGRIQRHRKHVPVNENFYILSTNYRGLTCQKPTFYQPGFETAKRAFFHTDLNQLLDKDQYEFISAIPRVKQPETVGRTDKGEFLNFSVLEHIAQHIRLFGTPGEPECAKLWWQYAVSWCAELQAMQPFRKTQANEYFCLRYCERTKELVLQEKEMTSWPARIANTDKIEHNQQLLNCGKGVGFWLSLNTCQQMNLLAEQLDTNEATFWSTWTEIQLTKPKAGKTYNWIFDEHFGVYQPVKE